MDSINLDNVNVAFCSSTNGIHLYTHGENLYEPIEHKPIDGEVWSAIIQKVLNGVEYGESAYHIVSFGEKRFRVEVTPLEDEGGEDE